MKEDREQHLFSLRLVSLYTAQYVRMTEETRSLITVIIQLTGKHMQHFQIHSTHIKTTEENSYHANYFILNQ